VITFTSSIQVSGFGCQVAATVVDSLGEIVHEVAILSPVLTISSNHISVQDSIFPDT
jgi:hypothetical protein